jgi:hypothetical protein
MKLLALQNLSDIYFELFFTIFCYTADKLGNKMII